MSEVVAAPSTAPSPAPRSARSRAATRELWLDRLARFPASGLTVAQFCALEAVSVCSFYSWRRRLTSPQEPTPDPQLCLLPVHLPSPSPVAELVLGSGAVLRLPTGCDLSWVRSLVAALGDLSC